MAQQSVENNYAVKCEGITKTFGKVVANDNINLDVRFGEILALLGENGSGKTTLMNMLSGIYHPDKGSISISGKQVSIKSPMDSINLGIGMIHQHFKLVEVFTAAENIVSGTKGRLKSKSAIRKELYDIAQKLGLDVDPDKKVYEMSVSEKQNVEILKVLYRGSRILILDEPTAVLTPQETDKLFEILRKMKADGCAVIIITHKLGEVMAISDRVTILRKGQSVETVNTSETNEKQLTDLMVGKAVDLSIERPDCANAAQILNVVDLTVKGTNGATVLDDVSFYINRGEILGIAGVAGSGQKELCETIAGLHKIEKGAILYKKENLAGKSPKQIIDMGISMSFVPEDRLGMGLIASAGITDNLMLKNYQQGPVWFVNGKEARQKAKELIERLDIQTPSTEQPVRMLSGGNVQKVLLGREIQREPDLLITAYPVRGLDINSSYMIYDMLNEQKKRNAAVLFIGEDLDVLLALCDNIMVLCHGKNMGICDAKKVTKDQIGLMMTGATKEEALGHD